MRFGWLILALLVVGCGSVPKIKKRKAARELVGVWYTVQPGDTAARIAKTHKLALADLVELNGLEDGQVLQVGRPIFLYGVERILKREKKARQTVRSKSKAVTKRQTKKKQIT